MPRHRIATDSVQSHTHDWEDVTGEPATYPPSAHTHAISDITNLQTQLDSRPLLSLTKRTITTHYTLVLGDATNMVMHSTSATAVTITLPSNSSVAIPQEQAIPWRQYGIGQITFSAGLGATLISRGSAFKSAGQYAGGILTKVDTDTWLLEGDIVE